MKILGRDGEMKYWFCVTNNENWEVIKKQKIWGVPEPRSTTIGKVKLGDRLVIYTKPRKIEGIFEAVSESFRSEKKIFKPIVREGIFPYRVRLKVILAPKDPINFSPLIQKLAFIKNKRMWGVSIRTTMRTISKEDYRTIESALV